MSKIDRRDVDPEGRRASDWLTMALTIGIIGTAVLGFIAWRWGFAAGEDHGKRIAILTPFAAFLGAIVTFATIVWRGLISARQADQQQRQIEQQQRQIDSGERQQTADLLERGAGLIEEEYTMKQNAGLALLNTVATSNHRDFAEIAIHLLTDFLDGQTYDPKQWDQTAPIFHAARYLDDIAARRGQTFVVAFTVENAVRTIPWERFASVTYKRCFIVDAKIDSILRTNFIDCRFRECLIDGCVSIIERCIFFSCRVIAVDRAGWDNITVYFTRCDFSGCEYLPFRDEDRVSLNDCYYWADRPPAAGVLKWLGNKVRRIEAHADADEFPRRWPND